MRVQFWLQYPWIYYANGWIFENTVELKSKQYCMDLLIQSGKKETLCVIMRIEQKFPLIHPCMDLSK